MRKRNFLHSVAEVSRMGIGAMSFSNFYGEVSRDEVFAILDVARDLGVSQLGLNWSGYQSENGNQNTTTDSRGDKSHSYGTLGVLRNRDLKQRIGHHCGHLRQIGGCAV